MVMRSDFGRMPNAKIPENPRFAKTRTKLDTGPNTRKILEQYQGSGPNGLRKQKNEFYVRLRPVTLGQLLGPLVEGEESIYRMANDDAQSVVSSVVPSVAGTASMGEGGNICIFDLRPFEEFEQCHVYGARHLDVSMLNRSTNNFPREVYFYKGPVECDKMIVLYDEDGKSARAAGNIFVERGVENTYVVSGGFLGLCATCPHVLVGHPPSEQTLVALMARAGLKPPGQPSARSTYSVYGMSARGSTAGSVRTQNTNLHSIAGSVQHGRAWK